MENQTWDDFISGKSIEDLKEDLLYTTMELEQTKMAVQEELRKRDDHLSDLKSLLFKAVKERDEAEEKFQKLLLENLMLHQNGPVSGVSSVTSSDCEGSIVSSPTAEIPSTPAWPLPENGRFLQAVMRAGPLLQTLLLAGPLPQWRHPPPKLDAFEIPPVWLSVADPASFSRKRAVNESSGKYKRVAA